MIPPHRIGYTVTVHLHDASSDLAASLDSDHWTTQRLRDRICGALAPTVPHAATPT